MSKTMKKENNNTVKQENSRFLKSVSIRGYKLYDEFSIELDHFNIITGPNGAGKSAFLSIFDMLHHLAKGEFQLYIEKQGGAEEILHGGSSKTQEIEIEIWFESEDTMDKDGYAFELYFDKGLLYIRNEALLYQNSKQGEPVRQVLREYGNLESALPGWVIRNKHQECYVYEDFLSSIVYHFCDTGWTSRMKTIVDIYQVDRLWWDGGNIAAYLYYLQKNYPESYQKIVETVQRVAEYFVDFHLVPNERANPPTIYLRWIGQDNKIHPVVSLSDGTLRFICLSTLLLQPTDKMPSVILIDEPEIGLGELALEILRDMIRNASRHRTLIIATYAKVLAKQKLSSLLWGH